MTCSTFARRYITQSTSFERMILCHNGDSHVITTFPVPEFVFAVLDEFDNLDTSFDELDPAPLQIISLGRVNAPFVATAILL